MARRITRRRRSQSTATATNGSAATLLSQVSELVTENQTLVRENRELHLIVARVSQAVKGVTSRPVTGNRVTVSQSRPAGRPRQRRKITDPATLERRRAALAKARQVLADKRASSKAE